MVIDGDSTSVEEEASPGPDQPSSPGAGQPARDFSSLHGFQFVGAKDGPAGDASGDESAREALRLELDARAARFHQAVDSSIVLSSDGAVRWLGDPVARLAAGEDVLAPRTILLADPAMSEEAQKIVRTRLDLWLQATVQRLLGPLFSLRTLQEGSQQLQELATRIANAFGVLDREPVRGVVRNLDQNARGLLRRQGVRFGSYYLYVPSTLRPAARALALQLACIRKGDEAFAAAAQGLIPMASSGRTSALPDPRIDAETYRVGGFRACGDRVVRVDIVERLADMIRAASVLRVVGADSAPPAFQVTSQMTSLTGCSGDGFASILKALGFESLTLPRREVVWPAAAAPAALPPEAAGALAEGAAEAGAADEEAAVAAGDAPDLGEHAPAAHEGGADGPHADAEEHGPEDEAADETVSFAAAADESLADAAAPASDSADASTAEAAEAEAPPPEEAVPDTDSSVAEQTEPEAAPDAASPADGDPAALEAAVDAEDAAHSAPSADGVAAALEATGAADAAESAQPGGDETVTIWRFVRLRTTHPPRRPRPARRPSPAPAEHRAPPPGEGPRESQRETAPTGGRPHDAPAQREKRPAYDKSFHGKRNVRDGDKGQRPPHEKREFRGAEGRPGGDRKPAIDPMSPFAKLMELRSILEAESKKRK